MFDFLKNVPSVNIQAFVALALFGVSLLLARMVVNIQSGKWPGSQGWVLYLRMVLGFTFAASIGLGIYSFAGVDILFR
ncbi:MAG: flagellar biosynthesis protein FliR [Synergistaceae bacterium]|nr:flagellar biosynthesis protein FliR [Synergistaceae bacterium]